MRALRRRRDMLENRVGGARGAREVRGDTAVDRLQRVTGVTTNDVRRCCSILGHDELRGVNAVIDDVAAVVDAAGSKCVRGGSDRAVDETEGAYPRGNG